MTVEYRVANADEMAEIVYTGRLGFGDSTDPAEIEQSLATLVARPEWNLIAIDRGVIAARLVTYPFQIAWNGREIGCGGVTGVATRPTHRRRGHLRELMRRAFVAMREHEQPVAMLWASMAAIYQRFGYGLGWANHGYEFDPRALRFVDPVAVTGEMRLVPAADALPVIADAYRRFAAPRTLLINHDPPWLQGRLLRTRRHGDPPPLVAVYEEAGEVLGYVVYSIVPIEAGVPGPSQRLEVSSFVWLTLAAHRAIISYLAGYDLARTVRLVRLPADDPLFHQVEEPRLLDIRITDGTLVRIVDVQAALDGRGYGGEGRIRFALHDELCPWNEGTWELTAGGAGRARRADGPAELSLSARGLALLATGHLDATTLARFGLLSAADPTVLSVADRIFRTAYAPVCLDGF